MFLQFAGVLSLSQRSFCSTPSEEDKVAVYSEEKERVIPDDPLGHGNVNGRYGTDIGVHMHGAELNSLVLVSLELSPKRTFNGSKGSRYSVFYHYLKTTSQRFLRKFGQHTAQVCLLKLGSHMDFI
ncbi:hypothetical protein BCV71DRAFT_235284 [Rhizopus microsporus]|uniref:Uncharacterized protein n=1 Tax=Rhizopus microsporus TaxID=58291 RepID=A0A1X0S194_RHIZD|nr:hypothetical protein BCV71DRAFT_235284 [Rhizopus microsporus]